MNKSDADKKRLQAIAEALLTQRIILGELDAHDDAAVRAAAAECVVEASQVILAMDERLCG